MGKFFLSILKNKTYVFGILYKDIVIEEGWTSE